MMSLRCRFCWMHAKSFLRERLITTKRPTNGFKRADRHKKDLATSRFIVNPWELIKRRMSSLAALDLCVIYRFLIGAETSFPTRILRRKPLVAYESDVSKNKVALSPINENTARTDKSRDSKTFAAEGVNWKYAETEVLCQYKMDDEGTVDAIVNSDPLEKSQVENHIEVKGIMNEGLSDEVEEDHSINGTFIFTASEKKTFNESEHHEGDVSPDYVFNFRGAEGPPKVTSSPGKCTVKPHTMTDNKSYSLFEECNSVQGEEIIPASDIIHIDTAESIILDNFASDMEFHDRKSVCVHESDCAEVVRSLENMQVPPILSVDSSGLKTVEAPSVSPRDTSPKRSRKPQEGTKVACPPPKRDSSLLEISSLSQASFVREILEIHERISTSAPNLASTYLKPKPTTRNMATQTDPDKVSDSPVRRGEFVCQVDYLERALVDHERRLRVFEAWQERIERRVNGLDAECYNNHSTQRAAHDKLIAENIELREMVRAMQVQSSEKGCLCNGFEARSKEKPQQGNRPPSINIPPDNAATERESICLPIKFNNEPARKPARREYERGVGTYDSFMKAASKLVPQNSASNEDTNDNYFHEVRSNAPALPQRPLRRARNRGAIPKTPCKLPESDLDQLGGNTSTPIDKSHKENVSLADIENDDDNIVDDFIASMVIQDGKCINGPTQRGAEKAPTIASKNKAARLPLSRDLSNKSAPIKAVANPKNVCMNNFPNNSEMRENRAVTNQPKSNAPPSNSLRDKYVSQKALDVFKDSKRDTLPGAKPVTSNARGPRPDTAANDVNGACASIWDIPDNVASQQEVEKEEGASYAGVAAKYPWNTVGGKRKRV